MITLLDSPRILDKDGLLTPEQAASRSIPTDGADGRTLAARILAAHDTGGSDGQLRIRFDALTSHDITFVGIVQTARASGMERFPLPYVLTNCHNSLCAVGGTINEDDHVFGLSAARKYGGVYVPPNLAVIHQYIRERIAACGAMVLGSDSHTRYGALGCMGVGEGGPELVKQLLEHTYDLPKPKVVAVWLEGTPQPGVGPQDVALALVGAVFKSGFVKNAVLEFCGPGIAGLSVEYRCGIDVMTTETTCLSSIWPTDDKVRDYLALHGRAEDYKPLTHEGHPLFDKAIVVRLDRIRPMIALPFHPSNAMPIEEFARNAQDVLAGIEEEARRLFGDAAKGFDLRGKIRDGALRADQAIIAGCAGGSFENLCLAASVLDGKSTGNGEFSLSVYPASAPQSLELVRCGAAAKLLASGAVMKNAFCGPCFGAGDTPANGALSLRHSTRNFPNREGSKPLDGQLSAVALMDARSIAATAANGGRLTPATEVDWKGISAPEYHYDKAIYERRVYDGRNRPQPDAPLVLGPNIADWPAMDPLPRHLVLGIASVIRDPVTTTDELIPSGETSSLRSNPVKLAQFTLGRKDPGYVARAKEIQAEERSRKADPADPEVLKILARDCKAVPGLPAAIDGAAAATIGIGSAIYACKPGDGSAREQAASSQKVLGGWANLAQEYATKRYRSNLINWGMLPFVVDAELGDQLAVGDRIVIPNVRESVEKGRETLKAWLVRPESGPPKEISLNLPALPDDQRRIVLEGCLINFYNSDRRPAKG